jgi:hypothetical protein
LSYAIITAATADRCLAELSDAEGDWLNTLYATFFADYFRHADNMITPPDIAAILIEYAASRRD